ncbi:hypothetical protein CEXT_527981 [Caerostris extrusa]|uniref:Uncharacterized protein n=1 Tax=Caerostris extrusa TaxID=172846 RepID=A0AAV4XCM7_CAEEX|nr:hypothetical protein CEXT_527981 [Caerostris extrusa]
MAEREGRTHFDSKLASNIYGYPGVLKSGSRSRSTLRRGEPSPLGGPDGPRHAEQRICDPVFIQQLEYHLDSILDYIINGGMVKTLQ